MTIPAPTPPFPDQQFELLYADPPWRYTFSKNSRNSPERHYATLPLPAICALPVSGIAARNSILVLWTTSPQLDAGIQVMKAWGFTYRTSAIWAKTGLGMGFYWRQSHELLLLGTRGKGLGAPPPSARPHSVIHAAKAAHSVKPALVQEQLEAMWPFASRLELFARRNRPGWTAWGLEAPAP
jgi:N6-adenosine-specific RNA methylase IME4